MYNTTSSRARCSAVPTCFLVNKIWKTGNSINPRVKLFINNLTTRHGSWSCLLDLELKSQKEGSILFHYTV